MKFIIIAIFSLFFFVWSIFIFSCLPALCLISLNIPHTERNISRKEFLKLPKDLKRLHIKSKTLTPGYTHLAEKRKKTISLFLLSFVLELVT